LKRNQKIALTGIVIVIVTTSYIVISETTLLYPIVKINGKVSFQNSPSTSPMTIYFILVPSNLSNGTISAWANIMSDGTFSTTLTNNKNYNMSVSWIVNATSDQMEICNAGILKLSTIVNSITLEISCK